jgi:hypothetical protein|tara:strand:- start:81 stop:206 length:126 start_codon:yes stop_codon:yes gene_type:complete
LDKPDYLAPTEKVMEHFTFSWDESEVMNKVLLGIKAIMPVQ